MPTPNLSPTTLPFSTASLKAGYAGPFFFIYDPASGKTVGFNPIDVIDWSGQMLIYCRESFQYIWEVAYPGLGGWSAPMRPDISSWIGYVSPNLNVINIANLASRWQDIETKLGIPESVRTVLHRAEGRSNTVIMHLSPFWTLTDTHRSFCTLFLRMVVDFWRESFDQSIPIYPLAHAISPAIAYWLSGHTKPSYDRLKITDGNGTPGVFNRFKGVTTPEALAKLLSKP